MKGRKQLVSFCLVVLILISILPVGTLTTHAAVSLSASKLTEYAHAYWQNYNSNYSNYNSIGGDCCNFVSQCLFAAGLPMDDNWYWYSYSNRSGSWTVCSNLKNFLVNSYGCDVISSPSASQIEVGDVLYYGGGSHVGICCEVINGQPWICAHNNDRHTSNWTLSYSTYAVIKSSSLVDNLERVNVPEGVYVFHNVRNPDRVLDIQYDSTECGANIQLYNNWYNQVQKFRVVNMGDYYCIQSVYSGMWLDISYPYDEDGCNIQLWNTNTSTEQKWVFEDAGNGNVYIRSLYGMYIDTSGGSTENNANVETYHFDGTTSQQWKLELTSPYGRKDVADGIYTFHNYRNENRVLDIMYDSTEIRANIQLYDDLNNSVQRFRVTKVLDDTYSFYYVIQSVYSGYWLDIASPMTTSGCNIQLWQDHNAPEQKWIFEDAGNGKVLIRSLYGTYVDLENGKTDNSTNVQTFNYDGSTSMEWVMHKVSTITYNANGGAGAPAEQAKQSDISLTLSTVKPSRTRYTFSGWNTKADGSGTNYASGAVYTGNADLTLYAQWKADIYTVNINANGGTVTTSSFPVEYGATCNLNRNYVQRDGYTLAGWNLYRPADSKWFVGGVGWCTISEISTNGYQKAQYDPNLGMALDSSWFTGCDAIVSSFTFYAVWIKSTYTVTLDPNDGVCGIQQITVFYDEPYGVLPVPTREGYAFSGWSLADGTAVTESTIVTTAGVHTLYAHWEALPMMTISDGSTAVIDEENGFIYGLCLEPTEQILNSEFLSAQGGATLDYKTAGYIGTGTVVDVLDPEGNTVQSFTIVIFGDADGDGTVSIDDIAAVKRCMTGVEELEPDDPRFLAADLDGDGSIGITDISMMKGMITGSVDYNQATRTTV